MDLDQNVTRPLRTNVLEEFFFLAPYTNRWLGIGYRIMKADNGVGTLYRYSIVTNNHGLSSNNLILAFMREPLTNPVTKLESTNFNRVADGVIHLKVTAFDSFGRPLTFDS